MVLFATCKEPLKLLCRTPWWVFLSEKFRKNSQTCWKVEDLTVQRTVQAVWHHIFHNHPPTHGWSSSTLDIYIDKMCWVFCVIAQPLQTSEADVHGCHGVLPFNRVMGGGYFWLSASAMPNPVYTWHKNEWLNRSFYPLTCLRPCCDYVYLVYVSDIWQQSGFLYAQVC